MPVVLPPDARKEIAELCEWVGVVLRIHYGRNTMKQAASELRSALRHLTERDYRNMARRTYSIHLRVNLDTDEQFAAIRTAVRHTARRLLTQASLVSPRPPDIAIESEDFFEGTEEIDLDEDAA